MTRKLLVAAGVLLALADRAFAAATWTNIGPEGAVVEAIAADPVNDFVVYAGVDGGGVFRSDPASDTFWHPMNTGLGDLNVRSLAASPAGGGVVLAGTDTGIYRTANGGGTWALAAGPPAGPIDEIAFDRTNPANVYAVSFEGWIGKSSDGGASWQALGGPASSQRPQAVHVDPTNGAIVYVGTIDGGLYKSTNGGSTWTAQNEGLTNLHVSAIAVDPTAPSTVYLGTDNGGAFRSTDGGAIWTVFDAGIVGNDVEDILVNPEGRAFLANSGGLFGSVDGGLGWTRLALISRSNALSLGPGNPGTLWIGFGQLPQSIGGVVFSTDPLQFDGITDGLNGVTIASMAADPSNPSILLACATTGTVLSPDGGGIWFATQSPPLGLSLAFDPQAPGVVYQGDAAGVAKSENGGVDWVPMNAGLPAGALVRAVLVLGGAAGRVLAGTNSGVYRTTDGGANWSAPGTATPATVYSLARDPASTAVWAGALDGVYRSTDDGATWALAGGATRIAGVLGSRLRRRPDQDLRRHGDRSPRLDERRLDLDPRRRRVPRGGGVRAGGGFGRFGDLRGRRGRRLREPRRRRHVASGRRRPDEPLRAVARGPAQRNPSRGHAGRLDLPPVRSGHRSARPRRAFRRPRRDARRSAPARELVGLTRRPRRSRRRRARARRGRFPRAARSGRRLRAGRR